MPLWRTIDLEMIARLSQPKPSRTWQSEILRPWPMEYPLRQMDGRGFAPVAPRSSQEKPADPSWRQDPMLPSQMPGYAYVTDAGTYPAMELRCPAWQGGSNAQRHSPWPIAVKLGEKTFEQNLDRLRVCQLAIREVR